MTTFSIRDPALSDMAELRELFRRASLSNPGDRAALLANPEELDLSSVAIREGRTRVATVEDGSIAGFATTKPADNRVELEDLFVDPSWRRCGLARALVSDSVLNARRMEIDRIEVVANPHALAFYQAVGFLVDNVVETKFGEGLRMHLDTTPSGSRHQR